MKNEFETSDPVFWNLDEVIEWIDPFDAELPTTRLLKALQAGKLAASGQRVTHDILAPPHLGQREMIHAFFWADLKIIQCDFGDSLCILERHGESWLPAWRNVLTERQQVLSYWVPRGSGVDQPPESYRSGLPGKPSSKHLYLAKLEERIGAGELATSIGKEALALKQWLKDIHPSAPSSGLSAIKNSIRDRYNEVRGKLPNIKISGAN